MIEIETERLTLKKLRIADKKHHLNKGGWIHKTGIRLCIYHPINLHGGEFTIFMSKHHCSYNQNARYYLWYS